jgi:hypothetical protein
MQAFFDADVIDVELLYDNAMLAVCYQQAKKFNVKYILAGSNQATEGMKMPSGWNWFKRDVSNIKALAKIFGNVKVKTFPTHSTWDFFVDEFIKKIRWISFLDYMPYNKFEVLNILERNYGYKRYPFKHYESIFTRFYQGYILPHKFGVDKRLLHYSTLVISGQMTREEAAKGLEGIPYNSQQDLDQDIKYFLKKMMWTDDDLKSYIGREGVSHNTYPTEEPIFRFIKNLLSDSLKKKIKKWLMK